MLLHLRKNGLRGIEHFLARNSFIQFLSGVSRIFHPSFHLTLCRLKLKVEWKKVPKLYAYFYNQMHWGPSHLGTSTTNRNKNGKAEAVEPKTVTWNPAIILIDYYSQDRLEMLVVATTWLNYNSQLSPCGHGAITIMMDRNSYIPCLNYKEMYWNISRY